MSGAVQLHKLNFSFSGCFQEKTISHQEKMKQKEFLLGVSAMLPLLLGVVPFGLVFGVLGISSGLSETETILMSSIIFAGASQVVFAQLWAAGSAYIVIGSSVALINLRHVLYSASVAQHLDKLNFKWRIILAYLLTDEAFAVSIKRFTSHGTSAFFHAWFRSNTLVHMANLDNYWSDCRIYYTGELGTCICYTINFHSNSGSILTEYSDYR